MSFRNLHDAIQAAFLWQDCHLWEFDFAGQRYGLPFDDDLGGPEVQKATNARLTKLPDANIETFLYTYDMGDNWEHRIDIIRFFEAETGARLPRFIAGEHRAPPEDVGGAPGFEQFIEAINDPSHPEHDDVLDWYGQPFDATDIDEETIGALFGRLAKRRTAKT